uniref:Uncharacterized protein n=1 Tax=Helianthus annuus TaxID=4232 RepID=A0A251TEN3_HELAN
MKSDSRILSFRKERFAIGFRGQEGNDKFETKSKLLSSINGLNFSFSSSTLYAASSQSHSLVKGKGLSTSESCPLEKNVLLLDSEGKRATINLKQNRSFSHQFQQGNLRKKKNDKLQMVKHQGDGGYNDGDVDDPDMPK